MDDNRKSALEELVAAAEALAAAGAAAERTEPAAGAARLIGVTAGAAVKRAEAKSESAATGWAESIAGQLLRPVTSFAPAQSVLGSLAPGGGGSFGGGLLKSLVSPLFRLFSFGGGDDAPQTVELPRYFKPPRQVHSLAIRPADDFLFQASDFDSTGRARPVAASAPQIVVQVNAMDSRSFVDHSQEIADAVKRAVLESNSLGDLIREMEG
jgi:hypothetical protein